MQEARITVGVAVYNIAPYLGACLDNVLAQTCADFDVIAVDDGSTDESGAILDAYAQKDARIRVIHQANAGVSVARNAMIEACETRWLWMVDGDDEIEPNAIESWMREKDDALDIVVSGRFAGVGEGKLAEMSERERFLGVKRVLCKLPAGEDAYGLSRTMWSSVWVRLFNVEFLREMNLSLTPGLHKAQDVLFVLQTHAAARRVGLLNRPLYRYIPRDTTSVTKRLNPRIPAYVVMLVDALDAFIAPMRSAELDEALSGTVLLQTMTAIELCFGHPQNEKPYAERHAAFRAFLQTPSIARRLAGLRRVDEGVARCARPFILLGDLRGATLVLRANRRLRRFARKLLRRGEGQSV